MVAGCRWRGWCIAVLNVINESFRCGGVTSPTSRPDEYRDKGAVGSAVPLMIITILLCALCAVSGCTRRDDPSNKPVETGRVILYTSVDQSLAELVLTKFREAHPGVKVLTRFDTEVTKTTGLVNRLMAERSNPQADVFWSSEVFQTVRLADEGMLQPLETPTLADWPKQYRDAEHRWYGFAARVRVIAYSPDRVTEPPHSWDELTDPRWKNRVVMADPNFGTTRGHVAVWYTLWGKSQTERFFEELASNGIRIVPSNSQAVREIINGSADLCLTDTDDVWAQRRNGHDIEMMEALHRPHAELSSQFAQGILLIPNTVALIADRPDNFAAVKFVEFLLSPDVEQLLFESDSRNIPIGPESISNEKSHRIINQSLEIDYAQVARNMPAAIETVNRILLSK